MSRKLDAAVAEGLGREVTFVDASFIKGKMLIIPGIWKYFTGDGWVAVPHYSTDGNAMLELIGELRERGLFVSTHVWKNETHEVEIYDYDAEEDECNANADTLPLAVALATYKALTGKEWSE